MKCAVEINLLCLVYYHLNEYSFNLKSMYIMQVKLTNAHASSLLPKQKLYIILTILIYKATWHILLFSLLEYR